MVMIIVTNYSHHNDYQSQHLFSSWRSSLRLSWWFLLLVRVLHQKATEADHVLYFWKSRWPSQAKYHRVFTQSVYFTRKLWNSLMSQCYSISDSNFISCCWLSFPRQGGGGPVETDQVQHHWKGASSKKLIINFAVHLKWVLHNSSRNETTFSLEQYCASLIFIVLNLILGR